MRYVFIDHMLTYKMGFKNLFVCTALLLVWKVFSVCGQAARVEYINQPYTSSVATGFNGYSNYVPSYPQSMPPIIIDDNDDDNWRHILYFLLFAMRNNRNCGSGNFGGCGCGGNCGGSCCCNCGGSCCCNSCCSYIPCPIPYPTSGPYPYSFHGFGGYPDNSFGFIEEPYQTGQGPTEINLRIITDSS